MLFGDDREVEGRLPPRLVLRNVERDHEVVLVEQLRPNLTVDGLAEQALGHATPPDITGARWRPRTPGSRRSCPKPARDLLRTPVDDVPFQETVLELEDLDREPRLLRKHAVLPVDHDDSVGAFHHIFYLEAELREPFEGPAGELGDLSLPSDNAVTRTPEREDTRALEDRVFGVVSHDAIRVPAVPALQPILHEAEVRHASPLPSRLRGVAARALLPPTSTGMLPARFDARAGSSERVQTAAAQRLSRRGVLVTPGAHGVRSPLVAAVVQPPE